MKHGHFSAPSLLNHPRRLPLLLVIVFLVFTLGVAWGAKAFAQGPGNYYTGCLQSAAGTLYNVKSGTTPLKDCRAGDTMVSFNLLSVAAGTGLTGGGMSGDIALSLRASYQLPQACTLGQVPKWNSNTSTWECAVDNTATYTAGPGLALSDGQFSLADQGVTSAKLADGSVTSDKIASDTAQGLRLLTWDDLDRGYSFPATGGAPALAYTVDPGFSVMTVPPGKAYYYLVEYSGLFGYSMADRVDSQGGFYGHWEASVLANGEQASPSNTIVQTGYRQDWATTGGSWYWNAPFHTSWLVRLTEGAYSLKIGLVGYSDSTMKAAGVNRQRVQVMRLY